jgi:hypothetical protein
MTILRRAKVRCQEARGQNTQTNPTYGSWPTAAESRTSQVHCISMLRKAGTYTFALVQLYSVPQHVGIGQCYHTRLSAILAP